MSRSIRILIIFLCLVSAAAAGLLVLFYSMNRPSEYIPEEGVVFTVENGDTLADIANRLEEEDCIKSSFLFRVLGKVYNTGGRMKSGLYRIEPDYSTTDVHNLLVSGNQMLFKVTIPEGWTSRMIGDLLEEKGITDSEEFGKACRIPEFIERTGSRKNSSVEGFLYPDTYYFPRDYPAERIVAHMIDMFFATLTDIYPQWSDMPKAEVYERVILASIIEREYRDAAEAPLIASVFYNRLEEGMTLGSCATVVYALTEEKGREHPERLTYDDLEIHSEYNTYRHEGLPPGPISNPGFIALDAAFHPEQSDYLYFVLKDPEAGRHYFSRSLGEHNQAYTFYIKRNY